MTSSDRTSRNNYSRSLQSVGANCVPSVAINRSGKLRSYGIHSAQICSDERTQPVRLGKSQFATGPIWASSQSALLQTGKPALHFRRFLSIFRAFRARYRRPHGIYRRRNDISDDGLHRIRQPHHSWQDRNGSGGCFRRYMRCGCSQHSGYGVLRELSDRTCARHVLPLQGRAVS